MATRCGPNRPDPAGQFVLEWSGHVLLKLSEAKKGVPRWLQPAHRIKRNCPRNRPNPRAREVQSGVNVPRHDESMTGRPGELFQPEETPVADSPRQRTIRRAYRVWRALAGSRGKRAETQPKRNAQDKRRGAIRNGLEEAVDRSLAHLLDADRMGLKGNSPHGWLVAGILETLLHDDTESFLELHAAASRRMRQAKSEREAEILEAVLSAMIDILKVYENSPDSRRFPPRIRDRIRSVLDEAYRDWFGRSAEEARRRPDKDFPSPLALLTGERRYWLREYWRSHSPERIEDFLRAHFGIEEAVTLAEAIQKAEAWEDLPAEAKDALERIGGEAIAPLERLNEPWPENKPLYAFGEVGRTRRGNVVFTYGLTKWNGQYQGQYPHRWELVSPASLERNYPLLKERLDACRSNSERIEDIWRLQGVRYKSGDLDAFLKHFDEWYRLGPKRTVGRLVFDGFGPYLTRTGWPGEFESSQAMAHDNPQPAAAGQAGTLKGGGEPAKEREGDDSHMLDRGIGEQPFDIAPAIEHQGRAISNDSRPNPIISGPATIEPPTAAVNALKRRIA